MVHADGELTRQDLRAVDNKLDAVHHDVHAVLQVCYVTRSVPLTLLMLSTGGQSWYVQHCHLQIYHADTLPR